jgi:hypothetical protein
LWYISYSSTAEFQIFFWLSTTAEFKTIKSDKTKQY